VPRSGAAGTGKKSRGLSEYESKRNFARTPEPAPAKAKRRRKNPRFVLHEHHARRLHWDLRLEHDGALASWALPKGLPDDPAKNHLAIRTEDHPLEYLSFHGEIPAGQYGAGDMKIADHGTYECLKCWEREVDVVLHGVHGEQRYVLFATDKDEPPKQWMIHRMGEAADPTAGPMPDQVEPMLATAGELPAGDGWAYEVKWDGVRAIASCDRGTVIVRSRNLRDISATFPELRELGPALGEHRAVLDGEILTLDATGTPDFGALVQRVRTTKPARSRELARSAPAIYAIFDLLWLDGHSLMDEPYSERRKRLTELGLGSAHINVPESYESDGAGLLAATAERGLEGVVAKRLSSPYVPGRRSRDWVKVKSVHRQEFVVGGWLQQRGTAGERIGALLLGVHDAAGDLRYVGRVGSGLSQETSDELAGLLEPVDRSPFSSGRPPKDARFCAPTVVVEVRFAEWTEKGNLRHPVFLGVRSDKAAAEVVREEGGDLPEPDGPMKLAIESDARRSVGRIGGLDVALTNLDKPMYPAASFTKRDMIEYYAAVAPAMLAHLERRPVTLVRWPGGVDGKSFFQKQTPKHPDWIHTAAIETSERTIDYLLADSAAALVWAANSAAIELHVTLGRIPRIERALAVVFDLDPGVGTDISDCCRVALRLRAMFEQLNLACVVKTSGKKGLHMFLPLNGDGASYPDVKSFARTVAEMFERELPDEVVSTISREDREGRVLIDWRQNEVLRTEVAAYSLRAVEYPSVSTPLDWDEVEAVAGGAAAGSLIFAPGDVLARVASHGDLLAPALSLVQRLPGAPSA